MAFTNTCGFFHCIFVMNVSPTQKKKKKIVPGRWIGDNVLCHLEEVEYLQQTGQPGCLVFLDFSKAYDRLSRSWVQKCMSSMGFGQNACKWVSIMLHNTSATAAINGWRSASFPERSGVQQGRVQQGSARQPIVSLAVCDSGPTSCQPPQTPVSARCHKANHHARWSASTFFFFLGYRIVVHSFQAKEPSGHQTNLRYPSMGLAKRSESMTTSQQQLVMS